MVEGPGATCNAQKLQGTIGSKIKEIYPQDLSMMSEMIVEEAFCVGKEVFLVTTNGNALRLHFGMNGSLQLKNQGSVSTFPSWRQTQAVSLRIVLQSEQTVTQIVECWSTTINTLSAFVARSKRERLAAHDVCSPNNTFSPLKVIKAIRKRPDAMIADAILDQDIFPGVGNIIKMEGLHLAMIHPQRTVHSLCKEELSLLVHHCRNFAMKWQKTGYTPSKLVYNQTSCQTCQGSVRMMKLGLDISRVTFWCISCQPLSRKRPFQETTHHNTAHKQTTLQNEPITCPQHGTKPMRLCRVRTSQQNQNRLFVSCQAKGCSFFRWADSQLSNCKCGEKCILRVSKTATSGGRWFLSCNKGKDGCSHFAWAQPNHLAPLNSKLTPLL